MEKKDDNSPSNDTTEKNKNLKISSFYYINKNKLTLADLKNGRRIFHNKTELSQYDPNNREFNQHFIEFRQLFFENLLLNDDFTENIKQPLTIQSAVFSTFVYDGDFIEPLINAFKLKSIIIRHREEVKYNQMEEFGNYIKFVFPKIDYSLRWGKFHSKLILLKFPNFIRVIVPSANLTNGDWYYWGQIIWFQDFPLKKDQNTKKNEFQDYLEKFFTTFMPHTYEGKRFWTDLNINFNNYDFSNTCVDLIASANGRFKNKEMDLYGVGRLNHLMKVKYLSLQKNKSMIIQCSSIGKSLKEKFFSDVYTGFNLLPNPNIDIIYPTEDYINSFPLGKELSSCLFLSIDAYNFHKTKFKIIELKKEYEDKKTIFHSKCFITGERDKNGIFQINDNSIFYFGSHNFSAAALGSYEKGDTQVSIANYELGIIFNPLKITLEEKREIYNSLILNFDSRYYNKEKDYPFINEFS